MPQPCPNNNWENDATMPLASSPLTNKRASFLGLTFFLLPVMEVVLGGTSLDTSLTPESDPVTTCSQLLLPEELFEKDATATLDRTCNCNEG